ncbi:EGF-like repeat and discoidin I-like domain-containing protein 3 [Acropora palmata]|uniref:EGF-like repeat and discoidin I-like domain-containing protein 3 n=1 Tax=Acropora palmata TaxID=6131 RepID=UPI003DA0EE14
MELGNIVLVFILSRLYQPVFGQRHQIKRRSSNVTISLSFNYFAFQGEPKLHLKVSHSLGDNAGMIHGSAYDYGFVVSHDPTSRAHALGVHVTWMLTPFVKFHKVTSFQHIGSYRVEQKDDSVTFKIGEIPWMSVANLTFSVMFDSQRSLDTGKHYIVTPVHLLYYKEYSENPPGHVISKGDPYSSPLQKVAVEVEIPGCSGALGMASGEIKDYQLTASSSYSGAPPTQARAADGNDAWCAVTTDKQQYIQVDFTRKTRLTRVETYGRSEKEHWVKKYTIQYNTDEETWHNYTEHGFIKVSACIGIVFS